MTLKSSGSLFRFLSQKWKALAAGLEAQIEQVKQENNILKQQLQQQEGKEVQPKSMGYESHPAVLKSSAFVDIVFTSEETSLEPSSCKKAAHSSEQLAEKSARGPLQDGEPDISELHAVQIGVLAAECEQMLEAGMTEEACRFLMEVRSMQLAAHSTRHARALSASLAQALHVLPCPPLLTLRQQKSCSGCGVSIS